MVNTLGAVITLTDYTNGLSILNSISPYHTQALAVETFVLSEKQRLLSESFTMPRWSTASVASSLMPAVRLVISY